MRAPESRLPTSSIAAADTSASPWYRDIGSPLHKSSTQTRGVTHRARPLMMDHAPSDILLHMAVLAGSVGAAFHVALALTRRLLR